MYGGRLGGALFLRIRVLRMICFYGRKFLILEGSGFLQLGKEHFADDRRVDCDPSMIFGFPMTGRNIPEGFMYSRIIVEFDEEFSVAGGCYGHELNILRLMQICPRKFPVKSIPTGRYINQIRE